MTPSERAIAAWMRENIRAVPYNTGAQMAAAIGVSEMTLIRFLPQPWLCQPARHEGPVAPVPGDGHCTA
ncbi:MAG: hypothetical protein V9G11_05530 [Bifidobacterium adolescentis]